MYCPPALSSAGHGLYALIGHHPNPGSAPIPPPMRPSPPQPHGAEERATPQRAQVVVDESEEEGDEVEGSCFRCLLIFFVVLNVAVVSQRGRARRREGGTASREKKKKVGVDEEDFSFI